MPPTSFLSDDSFSEDGESSSKDADVAAGACASHRGWRQKTTAANKVPASRVDASRVGSSPKTRRVRVSTGIRSGSIATHGEHTSTGWSSAGSCPSRTGLPTSVPSLFDPGGEPSALMRAEDDNDQAALSHLGSSFKNVSSEWISLSPGELSTGQEKSGLDDPDHDYYGDHGDVSRASLTHCRPVAMRSYLHSDVLESDEGDGIVVPPKPDVRRESCDSHYSDQIKEYRSPSFSSRPMSCDSLFGDQNSGSEGFGKIGDSADSRRLSRESLFGDKDGYDEGHFSGIKPSKSSETPPGALDRADSILVTEDVGHPASQLQMSFSGGSFSEGLGECPASPEPCSEPVGRIDLASPTSRIWPCSTLPCEETNDHRLCSDPDSFVLDSDESPACQNLQSPCMEIQEKPLSNSSDASGAAFCDELAGDSGVAQNDSKVAVCDGGCVFPGAAHAKANTCGHGVAGHLCEDGVSSENDGTCFAGHPACTSLDFSNESLLPEHVSPCKHSLQTCLRAQSTAYRHALSLAHIVQGRSQAEAWLGDAADEKVSCPEVPAEKDSPVFGSEYKLRRPPTIESRKQESEAGSVVDCDEIFDTRQVTSEQQCTSSGMAKLSVDHEGDSEHGRLSQDGHNHGSTGVLSADLCNDMECDGSLLSGIPQQIVHLRDGAASATGQAALQEELQAAQRESHNLRLQLFAAQRHPNLKGAGLVGEVCSCTPTPNEDAARKPAADVQVNEVASWNPTFALRPRQHLGAELRQPSMSSVFSLGHRKQHPDLSQPGNSGQDGGEQSESASGSSRSTHCRGQSLDGLSTAVSSSMTALSSLQDHTHALQPLVARPEGVTSELAQETWRYVKMLEAMNKQWTALRVTPGLGRTGSASARVASPAASQLPKTIPEETFSSTLTQVISRAAHAEAQAKSLTGRVEALLGSSVQDWGNHRV